MEGAPRREKRGKKVREGLNSLETQNELKKKKRGVADFENAGTGLPTLKIGSHQSMREEVRVKHREKEAKKRSGVKGELTGGDQTMVDGKTREKRKEASEANPTKKEKKKSNTSFSEEWKKEILKNNQATKK